MHVCLFFNSVGSGSSGDAIVWEIINDVSEKSAASIFKVGFSKMLLNF